MSSSLVLQASRLGERLAEKKMRLELRESALDWLARYSYDPVYGARWVRCGCLPQAMSCRLVDKWGILVLMCLFCMCACTLVVLPAVC